MIGWLLSHEKTVPCLSGAQREHCWGPLYPPRATHLPGEGWLRRQALLSARVGGVGWAEPEAGVGAGGTWWQLDRVGWCHLIPQPLCSGTCAGAGCSRSSSSRPPGVVTAAHQFQQAALKLGREGTGYVWWQKAGVHLETWRQRLEERMLVIFWVSSVPIPSPTLQTLAVY